MSFPVPVMRGAIRLNNGRLLGARTTHEGNSTVLASESKDSGKTWKLLGPIVVDPSPSVDLGDGAFLESKRHGLLYVCRHNDPVAKAYAIEIYQSRDGGQHWSRHSTPCATNRGLWAPALVETLLGELLCVYDDEDTPARAGFPGHQWLMGRFWEGSAWGAPVTLSRAAEPTQLSRDGMGTVVTVGKRLLCALESVDTTAPHPNCLRLVGSTDGGHTWTPRQLLYQPQKPRYMALAPCLVRLSDKTLVCTFCTDEDRNTPDRSGTPPPQLNMDIKAIVSHDGGTTWSAPCLLAAGGHRNYLPGLVPLSSTKALLVWIDFDRGLQGEEVRFLSEN